MKLTEIQITLIERLKQFNVNQHQAIYIAFVLKEDNGKLSLMEYLDKNPNAKEKEIINEFERICEKKDKV